MSAARAPLPNVFVHDFSDATADLVRAEPAAVAEYDCDMCDQRFEGEPAGSGLFIWTRGEEVRYEEPPLCQECADSVTRDAWMKWAIEEEEEG